MSAMQLDATFLITITVCCLIIITEDKTLGFFSRATAALVGSLCFAQALWLLGIWIPSAAGYPWPRLTLDGAFALAALVRAVTVLMALYRPVEPERNVPYGRGDRHRSPLAEL